MDEQDKGMDRRNLLAAASLVGGVAMLGPRATLADDKTARFGDAVTPPAKEGYEKHVPHINAPEQAKAGEPFAVTVTVGKEKKHPNTPSHHIRWIHLYAKEDGSRPLIHVASLEFEPGYAEPRATFPVILQESSTLHALGYCNLHGVWDNSVKVEIK